MNKITIITDWYVHCGIKKERVRGQKEAKSPNPLSGNIKVTIPNGICKVYDIIPAPFSLIECFIKISPTLCFQKKPFKWYWKKLRRPQKRNMVIFFI